MYYSKNKKSDITEHVCSQSLQGYTKGAIIFFIINDTEIMTGGHISLFSNLKTCHTFQQDKTRDFWHLDLKN